MKRKQAKSLTSLKLQLYEKKHLTISSLHVRTKAKLLVEV